MLITPNRSWPTVYTIDDNDKRFLYTPSSQSTFQDSFEVFIKDAQLFICWWSLYPLRHAVCWGFCSFSSFVWITLHLLHVDLSSSRSPKHCGVNSSYLMSTLVWLVITVCSFCPFPDLNLFLPLFIFNYKVLTNLPSLTLGYSSQSPSRVGKMLSKLLNNVPMIFTTTQNIITQSFIILV